MKLNKKISLKIIACSSLLLGTILTTSLIATSCSTSNESNNSSNNPSTTERVFTLGTFEEVAKILGVQNVGDSHTNFISADAGKNFYEANLTTPQHILEEMNKLQLKFEALRDSIAQELTSNPQSNPDFIEINNVSKLYMHAAYYNKQNKYMMYYYYYDKQYILEFIKNSGSNGTNLPDKIMYSIQDSL